MIGRPSKNVSLQFGEMSPTLFDLSSTFVGECEQAVTRRLFNSNDFATSAALAEVCALLRGFLILIIIIIIIITVLLNTHSVLFFLIKHRTDVSCNNRCQRSFTSVGRNAAINFQRKRPVQGWLYGLCPP